MGLDGRDLPYFWAAPTLTLREEGPEGDWFILIDSLRAVTDRGVLCWGIDGCDGPRIWRLIKLFKSVGSTVDIFEEEKKFVDRG